MRNIPFYLLGVVAFILFIAASTAPTSTLTSVNADVKSISAIAFGPDGILFIGDSKSACVFAINTKDTKKQQPSNIEVKNIDQKIAAALGTTVSNITITDMAVNPLSKILYIALQNTDGTPLLLKLVNDKLEAASLKEMNATSVVSNNSPAEDAKDTRGRSLRISTISDLGYADGNLLVSGLSNHEFSSSFKSIPYPFSNNKQDEATLEIYHAAHGRYETSAPIRTFTTATINNKKYIVASYTCTPLVLFPMDELKPGMHVKGRTVAEMGSGNTPIDMISLQNGKESFLVMANTKHPVARVNYKNIAAFEGTLTEPVKGTAGVAFTTTDMKNVIQMDKLDDKKIVVMQKKENGDVDLWTANDNTF